MQTIDLGANHQMALEVRPAHDPVREYSEGRFTPLVLRQIQPAADNAVARG